MTGKFFALGLTPLFLLGGCTIDSAHKDLSSSTLGYSASAYVYSVNAAVNISPTSLPSGKSISSCTLTNSQPNLPNGLSLNNQCVVTGSAATPSPIQAYNIVATFSDGSTQWATFWLSITDPNQSISGLSYPQTSYSFVGPGPITPIVPSQNTVTIQQCAISPPLPLGLVLQANCQIIGGVLVTSSNTSFTVTAVTENGTLQTTLSISTSLYGIDPVLHSLAFYLDARAPGFLNGTYSGCSTSLPWYDLEGSGTYAILGSCLKTSGWYGDGSTGNPYRFRADTDQNSGSPHRTTPENYIYDFQHATSSSGMALDTRINPNLSVSFWARPLTSATVDLFSGASFPVFYFVNSGLNLMSVYNSGSANVRGIVMTPWISGKGEWHHYALTAQFVSLFFGPGSNQLANNNIKAYVDGQLVYQVTNTPGSFNYVDGNATPLSTGLMLGEAGTVEFTQFKVFDSLLSPSDILTECQSYLSYLSEAACTPTVGTPRTISAPDISMAVGSCYQASMSIVDLQKTSAQVPQTTLNFSTSSDIKVYAPTDTTCQTPLTSLTYPAAAASFNFYISSATMGSNKTLTVTPQLANVAHHDFLVNVTGVPTQFTVNAASFAGSGASSAPVPNGGNVTIASCDGDANFVLSFQDSQGNLAVAPSTVSVSMGSYTATWNQGSSTVMIPVVPIPVTSQNISVPGVTSAPGNFSFSFSLSPDTTGCNCGGG